MESYRSAISAGRNPDRRSARTAPELQRGTHGLRAGSPGEPLARGAVLVPRKGDPGRAPATGQVRRAIAATQPPIAELIAAAIAWIVLAGLFVGLGLIALSALGSDVWTVALVAAAAVAIALPHFGGASSDSSTWQRSWRRSCLSASQDAQSSGPSPRFCSRGSRDPQSVPDLHAVLYRASGTDFLTYESFARSIVLDHSLNGGEAVFFYQPGSRYVLGFMHLLFGDGDVLITWWSMVALSLPFLALLAWNRRQGPLSGRGPGPCGDRVPSAGCSQQPHSSLAGGDGHIRGTDVGPLPSRSPLPSCNRDERPTGPEAP